MAAVLIDPATGEVHEQQEPTLMPEGTTEQEETGSLDEFSDTVQEEVEATPEPELPEKYQGKTAAELAQMHQEAEKALGRQGSEVGELRKAFDDYVQSSIESKNTVQEPEAEIDFFLDPDKAVERAIANHPKMRQAEAVAAEMKMQKSLAQLKGDYPNMVETLQDPKFKEWVDKSKIRKQLYDNADKSYDYDSAAELLGNWNDRADVVKATLEVEKAAQKNEVKRASTGNPRGQKAGKQGSKKMLRRTDIIKLMKDDPRRYEALQSEIMQAYQEGRVK